MDVYEALADPTRREIVAMLAAGERNAGDIAGRFEMAGPSVSRHLKVLRESGLISYRQQATSRVYHLEPSRLEEVRQSLVQMIVHDLKNPIAKLGSSAADQERQRVKLDALRQFNEIHKRERTGDGALETRKFGPKVRVAPATVAVAS